MTSLPILVTAFNRPGMLAGQIKSLRAVAPVDLFVSIDGPRAQNPDDVRLVSRTVEALDLIDWPVNLRVLAHPENLGCGHAMSCAISWFFDQVDYGVILEDDIRASRSFFSYAEELLKLHKSDRHVLSVSGATNYPVERWKGNAQYRLSRYPQVWGWGTWRDRWADYSIDIGDWREDWSMAKRWNRLGGSPISYLKWARAFDRIADGQLDTWDYQLVLLALKSDRYTTIPRVSLTRNVGFGESATHTKLGSEPVMTMGTAPTVWTGDPPQFDAKADKWLERKAYGSSILGVARTLGRRLDSYRHRNPEQKKHQV